jgi:hypothetical protein
VQPGAPLGHQALPAVVREHHVAKRRHALPAHFHARPAAALRSTHDVPPHTLAVITD